MTDSLYQKIKNELEDTMDVESYPIENGPIRIFINYFNSEGKLIMDLDRGLHLENICQGWYQNRDLELGQLYLGENQLGMTLTKGFDDKVSDELYLPSEDPEAIAILLNLFDNFVWLFSSMGEEYRHEGFFLKLDNFPGNVAAAYQTPPVDNLDLCIDLASLIYRNYEKIQT